MPRNYDIAELRRLDIAHHLPAQADWQEIEDLGGSRIITHAEGCYIHDGDGNRILDGMAGLWCVTVGYGRDELAEVAREQMLELPYYNSFFKTANAPAIMLADKISSLTGGRLPHVFFNSSGWMPMVSWPHILPVRPKPQITSSQTNNMPYFRQIASTCGQ